MPHGPTRIETKGYCIYCGKAGIPLTDEHIVPLALGGQHVIVHASCHRCAAITSRFEGDVAREMWGDARNSYAAPSRRKKRREKEIVLTDPDNPARSIRVPYADYPAPIVFYRMHPAGILQGLPNTVDGSAAWQFVAISDHDKNVAFERKYGMALTARFRHVPESFARLLAKIGYGQILCALDPHEFRPFCVPYILGEKRNPSYIVGGRFSMTPPDPGLGYVLRTAGFGDVNRLILVAEIRLLANNETPTYHVVVGDVLGKAPIENALRKIGGFVPLTLLAGTTTSDAALNECHWLAQAWPVPAMDDPFAALERVRR
jgi:hypothetical protein